MAYHVLAILVLILHAAFIAFVVFGAFLVLRWRKLIWIHVPAALWGTLTAFAGIVCPLTPLEVKLQQLGGKAGYEGGFIEHYLVAAIYPAGLTRELQMVLGFAALLPNVLIYGWLLTRNRRRTRQGGR